MQQQALYRRQTSSWRRGHRSANGLPKTLRHERDFTGEREHTGRSTESQRTKLEFGRAINLALGKGVVHSPKVGRLGSRTSITRVGLNCLQSPLPHGLLANALGTSRFRTSLAPFRRESVRGLFLSPTQLTFRSLRSTLSGLAVTDSAKRPESVTRPLLARFARGLPPLAPLPAARFGERKI